MMHSIGLHIYCTADRPTEVRLGIYVNSFYSINEQTMVSENSLFSLVCKLMSDCDCPSAYMSLVVTYCKLICLLPGCVMSTPPAWRLYDCRMGFITSPAEAVAKYCDEYVCVCVSVYEDIFGTTCAIFTKFCACCLCLWLGPPPACWR